MIPNPFVSIERLKSGGVVEQLEVRAPVPGGGLRVTHVGFTEEPDLFRLLLFLHLRPGATSLLLDAASQRDRLVDLGVLVPPDRVPIRASFRCPLEPGNIASPGPDSLAREQEAFRRKGYVLLEGSLIHHQQFAALRDYYREFVQQGFAEFASPDAERRYVAHGEVVARLFHAPLAERVESVTGQSVKPSYVYLSCYQPGAVLPRHTDRAQCELTISMQVDYQPEPEGVAPWPLMLDVDGSPVALLLTLGGGLLYKGCEIPHFREPLPAGHTSTLLLFHYVPSDFKGSLD